MSSLVRVAWVQLEKRIHEAGEDSIVFGIHVLVDTVIDFASGGVGSFSAQTLIESSWNDLKDVMPSSWKDASLRCRAHVLFLFSLLCSLFEKLSNTDCIAIKDSIVHLGLKITSDTRAITKKLLQSKF